MKDSIVDGIGKRAGTWNSDILMEHDYESTLDHLLEKVAQKVKSKDEGKNKGQVKSKGKVKAKVKEKDIIVQQSEVYKEQDDDEIPTEIAVNVLNPKGIECTKSSTKPVLSEQISLQSALVLSEVLGPPRCKNRRRRVGRAYEY